MKKESSARMSLILAMIIFGTIGIFRKYIPLSSGIVAWVRGVLGVAFLLIFIKMKKINMDWNSIRAHLKILLISGGLIGMNWVLLFESYRYTSVAVATLCYYMAPIFVMTVSPFVLKEKMTVKKAVCVFVALLGMVFVSGVLDGGISDLSELKGILFGLGAAAFYATVIMMNQKLKKVPTYDKTIMQLGTAAVILIPYILLVEDLATVTLTPLIIIMLIIVGVVHTGIAYALYFGSMNELRAQTVALFGYIDPIVAIILSALFLKEPMTVYSAIGAVLVLGATMISELPEKRK
ncbi:MAG: DMT family transporter [Lachnospiraceae bacterium]|nr:DMT family transporter [Lachnospiraceae bacterium]